MHCPACESQVIHGQAGFGFLLGTRQLFRCGTCDMEWIDPPMRLHESLPLYSNAYFADGYERHAAARAVDYRHAADILAEHVAPGARVVDVGCGVGLFVMELRRRRFRAVGLEGAAVAAEQAASRAPGFVARGSADAMPLRPHTFDAAVFLNVLGHLADPYGALRDAANALRPGGIILLQIPDFGSPWYRAARTFSRVARKNLVHLPTVQHRFSAAALEKVVTAAGIEPLARYPMTLQKKPNASATYELARSTFGLAARATGRGEELVLVGRKGSGRLHAWRRARTSA